MKVIHLQSISSIKVTDKLIVAILKKDLNAFKATSKQFLRNNQTYFADYSGMTA